MIEPVWVTQGLPVQRTSVSAWSVPGKVLIIRHGAADRIKLDLKYADIVQRIERNPATGKFDITYSYEDGRLLKAVGQIEPDGTFSETLTAADGTLQRNLYLLDTPRRMRIVRQKRAGTGWANASSAIKVGETPNERLARENDERREREAFAAGERARQATLEAEREAQWARDEADREAEDAEAAAQQRRSWQVFQNDMQGVVRKARQDADDSRRFREQIEASVAQAEEARRQREEEARRSSIPVPRSTNVSVAPPAQVNNRPTVSTPTAGPRPGATSVVPSSVGAPIKSAPRAMCMTQPNSSSTGLMGNGVAATRARLETMLRRWCGGTSAAQVSNIECKVKAGRPEDGLVICDANYVCPARPVLCATGATAR